MKAGLVAGREGVKVVPDIRFQQTAGTRRLKRDVGHPMQHCGLAGRLTHDALSQLM